MLNRMILLSIVIPTKNRYNTLIPVINLIIKSIPSLDYEIIIQDNSVANSQPEELSQVINNSRVRYFYNPIPVSVSENTNKALENAKGEYVCFIGDDDIVIPAIIDEVRKLKKDGGECLIYPPCYYWWDTVQFVNKDRFKKNQALWLPAVSRRRLLNSSSELQRVLSNGGVSYYQLPRLYHGIVSRKVLDRIYKRSFTYVIGASPDMSLAVSIAMEVETYSLIDFPLTVFGSSRGSGGGLTAERKHHGAIEEQEFLPKSSIERWDKRLPRYWSEYTVYPQTIIEVYNSYNQPLNLDFQALYASIAVNESYLWSKTKQIVILENRFSLPKWIRFFYILIKRIVGKLQRKGYALVGNPGYKVVECSDLNKCLNAIINEYHKNCDKTDFKV